MYDKNNVDHEWERYLVAVVLINRFCLLTQLIMVLIGSQPNRDAFIDQ